MAVVLFENLPFLVRKVDIKFRGGKANFIKSSKLRAPEGSVELKMQTEAKTLKDYLQDQIQYQVKCIQKYGLFHRCQNCGARSTEEAIVQHIDKRVCNKDAPEEEWEVFPEECGIHQDKNCKWCETKLGKNQEEMDLEKTIKQAILDDRADRAQKSHARSERQPTTRQTRTSSQIPEASGSSTAAAPLKTRGRPKQIPGKDIAVMEQLRDAEDMEQ